MKFDSNIPQYWKFSHLLTVKELRKWEPCLLEIVQVEDPLCDSHKYRTQATACIFFTPFLETISLFSRRFLSLSKLAEASNHLSCFVVLLSHFWKFKSDKIASNCFKLHQIDYLVKTRSNWFKLDQIGSNLIKLE